MSSQSLLINNLLSVPVLVFTLGVVAALFRSDARLPEPVYQAISIFLLFGIGLKGGHSLKSIAFTDFISPALAVLIIGSVVPAIAFFSLRLVTSLSSADRGAFAAHYGSTSLVTFTAGLLFLENRAISVEPYATALLTLMEIPGIVVGIYLGSRGLKESVKWRETLIETLTGKTIILLVGGLFVGYFTSEIGYAKVTPFFIDLQSGALTLFLLHLGFIAGGQLGQLKTAGVAIAIFSIVFPIVAGALGVLAGTLAGLSVGGAAILGILAASASYIAAPAAVSLGLPTANGSLALFASIGITFPFNLLVGIPLYLEMAKKLATIL
ncbi:MAG: sodium-dependent bicarbonate transport family permease [Candidatus Planktophila sp.]